MPKDYDYAKTQLELEPDLTLDELRALMQDGISHNTKMVLSPKNAVAFSKSLKWLEQFNTIEEVKEVLKL